MQHVLNKKENPTPAELSWYMKYSQEDGKLFNDFFKTLPMSNMGSLGPHAVPWIREICEICDPKVMLEIGFNVGYSANMWLSFTETVLYSVDNSTREHTLAAVPIVKAKYGDRFHFLNADSGQVKPLLQAIAFDFAFVDGDHSPEGVASDLALVRSLGISRIAMDDYWPMFSAAQTVLLQSGYEVERQWGNIVLCRWKDGK